MRRTDERARAGLVELRDDLPFIVGDMRETESAPAVADTILDVVATGTRTQRGAIVFGGEVIGARDVRHMVRGWERPELPRKTLGRDRRDPLFPVRVPLKAASVRGWLLVGRRPGGSITSRDDREALLKVAKPVASAIAISRTRENREIEGARATLRLERAVADLRERLAILENAREHRASRHRFTAEVQAALGRRSVQGLSSLASIVRLPTFAAWIE